MTTRKPRSPKAAAPAAEAESKELSFEPNPSISDPEVAPAPAPVVESAPAELTPEDTLEKKMAEIAKEGKADLNSGQRIGARLMAAAALRNRS